MELCLLFQIFQTTVPCSIVLISQKAEWCWKPLTSGTCLYPKNVIGGKKSTYINFTNNSFSYIEKCELKCTCRCIYTKSAGIDITLYFLLYSDSSSAHNCSWILKFWFLISAYCTRELGKKMKLSWLNFLSLLLKWVWRLIECIWFLGSSLSPSPPQFILVISSISSCQQ